MEGCLQPLGSCQGKDPAPSCFSIQERSLPRNPGQAEAPTWPALSAHPAPYSRWKGPSLAEQLVSLFSGEGSYPPPTPVCLLWSTWPHMNLP